MTHGLPSEGYYRTSDGLRLYYRDYGPPRDASPRRGGLDARGAAAPTLLCLHGLTRNSRDFEAFAGLMASHYRIVATDLRGRGHSDYALALRDYHPAQYVEDVWQLLAHLGLSRVAVVGTSLGGLMAMLMAHERPERLSAVVLNDVGPELDPRGLARVAESAGALPPVADWDAATAAVREATAVAFPDWSDARWRLFAEKMYAPSADGGLDVRMDRNIGVALRQGLSLLREDPWVLFDALRDIPTLAVHGAESDILTPEILQKMQQAKPDLEVVTVPRRGHAPNLDEPQAIEAIRRFLDVCA